MRDVNAKNVTTVQALLKADDITVGDDGKLSGFDYQLTIKRHARFLFERGAFLVQKNYPLTNMSEGKTGWAD